MSDKFKVGDVVRATCEKGKPYFITHSGWRGIVVENESYRDPEEICVRQNEFDDTHPVEPQYFQLVSRPLTTEPTLGLLSAPIDRIVPLPTGATSHAFQANPLESLIDELRSQIILLSKEVSKLKEEKK